MIALKILAILFLYSTFGLVHTYLARIEFKLLVAKKYPRFMPFYRLAYNIYAVLHFSIVYELSPAIDIRLYDLPKPYDIMILIPQFLAVGGIIWVFYRVGFKEFLGIAQIGRKLDGTYDNEGHDEQTSLIVDGPFTICRHPIYLFTTIWLVCRPEMNVDYLVSVLCIIFYFILGAGFEEARMLVRYGEVYNNYKKRTARFIPIIW